RALPWFLAAASIAAECSWRASESSRQAQTQATTAATIMAAMPARISQTGPKAAATATTMPSTRTTFEVVTSTEAAARRRADGAGRGATVFGRGEASAGEVTPER